MPHVCTNNSEKLEKWINRVLDPALYDVSLKSMLEVIPTMTALEDLEPSTPILIRADLDVPIIDGVVVDASRLDSFRKTIEFCQKHLFKAVLFGHIGRDAHNTAAPVARALEGIYGVRVHFVKDWFDLEALTITDECLEALAKARPGEIILLENTRKYSFETALWDIKSEVGRPLANELDRITVQVCSHISQYYIFDALASSNPDWSSIVIPAYMAEVGIAEDIVNEFKEHVVRASRAQVLIFSGLKMDKLDDLERIISHGGVELVLVGGALAMALMKGKAKLDNRDFSIGLAEDERSKGKKYYIGPERIQQAQRMLTVASEQGVRVVLPLDFVLDDGLISNDIPPDRLQMDVGPETMTHFRSILLDYMESQASQEIIVYYNGVLGKFEEPRYENGTKEMMNILKALTEAGAQTFVGGGEGLLALQKYGDESWVTHAFTSGGTILKAMSGRVISYLSSLAYYTRERDEPRGVASNR